MTKQHKIQQLQRLRTTLSVVVDKEQKKVLKQRIEQLEIELGYKKEIKKEESGAKEKPAPKEEKTSKNQKRKNQKRKNPMRR